MLIASRAEPGVDLHATQPDDLPRNILEIPMLGSTISSATETRISTGVAGLDDVLAGGLPAHHLYLIEGDPGTGKTTVALHFLREGVRQGEKGLYVTLSESKHELIGVARSHGWDLDGIAIHELAPQGEEIQPEAQYTVFHPAEVELADTVASVLNMVDETQATRVVVDSLSELRMLARDPLRYRRQILALKRFFAGRNCTVLLLDDRTVTANDLQLQSIAHGVIMMEVAHREYGTTRRRLEIRKLRGSTFREGYHDYTIQTGGVVVFPRLVASEYTTAKPQVLVRSGIAELDTLLGGGIDSGTSNLLLGPAGCGKSNIAVRYAIAATHEGAKSAFFTFDENLGTLVHRSAGLGMDLAGAIESGKVIARQVDPADMGPGEFVDQVRRLVAQGVKLVVIDTLNGFFYAMEGEQSIVLQLHELLSYLHQMGVTVIMAMAQHGILGASQNSPIDVSYLADTVLLIRYFESGGKVRKALSVVKKRTGAHEGSIRELSFNGTGIHVGEPLTEFEGVLAGNPRYLGEAGDLAGGNGKRHK
jgi:circadian clock protein KaiC